MIVAGTLIEIELGLALQLLGRARASGLVTLKSEEHEARLVLAEGGILHASSTTTARLGESLIERGVITRAVLEDALRHQRRKKVKQPLGTILHELGVLTRAMAEAEVEMQITRVLRDVFAWPMSRLHFEPMEVDARHVLVPEACQLELVLHRLAWAPAG